MTCTFIRDNFFHINHYLKSVSKVALSHRFYCSKWICSHLRISILDFHCLTMAYGSFYCILCDLSIAETITVRFKDKTKKKTITIATLHIGTSRSEQAV